MKQRNIVLAIILSIVTFGIYGIYWFVKMTDETNQMVEQPAASGVMAVLFSILTCGIYTFYWNYKMGKKVYEIQLKKNQPASDNSILYLVLALVGLSIVNWCLIQSELNKHAIY